HRRDAGTRPRHSGEGFRVGTPTYSVLASEAKQSRATCGAPGLLRFARKDDLSLRRDDALSARHLTTSFGRRPQISLRASQPLTSLAPFCTSMRHHLSVHSSRCAITPGSSFAIGDEPLSADCRRMRCEPCTTTLRAPVTMR